MSTTIPIISWTIILVAALFTTTHGPVPPLDGIQFCNAILLQFPLMILLLYDVAVIENEREKER